MPDADRSCDPDEQTAFPPAARRPLRERSRLHDRHTTISAAHVRGVDADAMGGRGDWRAALAGRYSTGTRPSVVLARYESGEGRGS